MAHQGIFQADGPAPLPIVIAPVETSLVNAVEFVGRQDSLVQFKKGLVMADGYIPVDRVILFKIDAEF
jgi:hypothetical protein